MWRTGDITVRGHFCHYSIWISVKETRWVALVSYALEWWSSGSILNKSLFKMGIFLCTNILACVIAWISSADSISSKQPPVLAITLREIYSLVPTAPTLGYMMFFIMRSPLCDVKYFKTLYNLIINWQTGLLFMKLSRTITRDGRGRGKHLARKWSRSHSHICLKLNVHSRSRNNRLLLLTQSSVPHRTIGPVTKELAVLHVCSCS